MKRARLEKKRWVESIEDFIREHGRSTPRWAVFLTYNVDLDRFARGVLPLLARRGRCFRSLLLSDQGALEQSLSVATRLPGSVNLHPIRCKKGGVFHPKLVFLRAGRHVRVCFGSANITDGGMGSNLELWTSSDSPEIVGGILHFLLELTRSRDIDIDQAACRSLKRAVSGLVESETDAVWSSLQESFASRLKRGAERSARRVTIVSPMYAGANGLKAARSAIPARAVSFYTDMNVPVSRSTVRVYSPPDPADSEEDNPDSYPRFLHAKAYVFHPPHGKTAVAWIGSANFTEQALTKSLSQRGNVELMIRTSLPNDEVEAFDDDLKTLFKKDTNPCTTPLKSSAPPKAVSTILSCELTRGATGLRLTIHSTQQRGHVVLVHEKRRVRAAIKDGRGVVEGSELRKFLPDLDLMTACSIVICQLVRGRLVPVVVNVPHVPPDGDVAGTPHASIDALLDDLLGRVRIPNRTEDAFETEEEPATSDEDGEGAADASEHERRLDQARHQGEIDQLAVKAALLKKLVTAPRSGLHGMLGDVRRTLLAASPSHLAPAIKSLFGDVIPPRSK